MRADGLKHEDTEGLDGPSVPPFLKDPIGLFRRRWPWMLLTLLAGACATSLYVIQIEPRFLANATVRVTSQQISEEFVRSTIAEDSLQRIDAMLGEILSRENLSGLIEAHDLYPALRESSTLAELADRMRDDIEITREESLGSRSRRQQASLLTISFEAHTPEAAAGVANDLSRFFTDESIRSRSEQSRMAAEFLRNKLGQAEQDLREQSRKITEFKERHRGELPDDLTANLSKLDRLQQQRDSLALRIAQAESDQATLSPEESTDPESRLLLLKARRIAESSLKTDTHPDMVALNREIESLEEEIRFTELTESGTSSAESGRPTTPHETLRELKAQLADTESAIREYDARLDRTPSRQEELAALDQRAGVLRENYLEYLRKVEDAELAMDVELAQQGERFSVVNTAVPPMNPTRSRLKSLVAGLTFTLLASVGIGILLESFDPVVLTPEQLEATAHLPVLGSVPRIV
jgi:uncharacterized protein involved in exopolysaccharide biosynthesis